VGLQVTEWGQTPGWLNFSPTSASLDVPKGGQRTLTLTVQVSPNAPTGTHTLKLRATYGNRTAERDLTLTVNPPPDFTVSLNPTSLTVQQGGSAGTTVNLSRVNFTGAVSLSLEGSPLLSTNPAPDKIAWSFTPNPVTGNQSALQIQVGASVQPNTYALVVRAQAQGLQDRVAILNLTVNAAPLGSISGVVISPGAVQTGSSEGLISPSLRNELQSGFPEEIVPGEVIVKFKPTVTLQSVSRLQVNGVTLEAVRPLALERTQLYRAEGLDRNATLALVAQLASRPDVEYAEPNQIMRAFKTPNDPFYGAQWHYPLINLPAAWDITTGSTNVRVAVLDTGILPHPDLAGQVIGGYDFISDPYRANDGDGRDPDPTDAGDEDYGQNSYHGTHVAGTVGAATNNNLGVAGVAWAVKIVPIRVLGKGGGTLADILDAIVWAAGGNVSGVPNNPYPAHVINMSLGGRGPCGSYQDAINFANSRGVIVVVAAGNSNDDASNYRPASCQGVITVGAVGPDGKRAPYSNYGSRIDVMAPGGDLNQRIIFNGQPYPGGVLSTLKDDSTGSWMYKFYQGTSMAAPHVAGVVALMKALNPSITYSEALQRLKNSATPLSPTQCNRPTGSDCGAGLIDAAKALSGGGSTPPSPPPPRTTPIYTYVFAFFCTTPTCLDPNGDLAIDLSRSRYNVIQQTQERTPYSIGGLLAGTYLAAAFQDLNDNEEYDEEEPLGVYPNPVPVAGNEVRNIDIQLRAVGINAASVEPGFSVDQIAALIRRMEKQAGSLQRPDR